MSKTTGKSEEFSLHLQRLSDEYESVLSAKRGLAQENSKLREQLEALIPAAGQRDGYRTVTSQVSYEAEYPVYTSNGKEDYEQFGLSPNKLASDTKVSGCQGDDDYSIKSDSSCTVMLDHRGADNDAVLALKPPLDRLDEDFNDTVLGERLSHSCPARQRHSSRPADKRSLDSTVVELELSDFDEEEGLPDMLPTHSLKSPPLSVFPDWFDPGASCLDEYTMSMERTIRPAEIFQNRGKSCGIVAPTNRKRLFWDAVAFFFLLFQMWLTPFELIYLDSDVVPQWMIELDLAFTFFWLLDIFINFCTGYIEGDTVILSRWQITKKYLACWFWVDLVATLPFDLMLEAVAGDLFQMSRLGRASKFLKTFRYLKMVRALRMATKLRQAQHIVSSSVFLQKMRLLARPAGACMFLACFAHIHGCFWALTQPDLLSAPSVSDALQNYYASFTWAYTGLSASYFRQTAEATDGAAWWLEVVISTERIMLMVLVAQRVIFHSLRFMPQAQKAQLEHDVLEYLRKRNVGFQTQIQVLFSLKDNGTAKQQQRNTEELMNLDLPPELRREIHKDLWSRHLNTLGLIVVLQSWDRRFVAELAQLVYEAVFASRCILFRLGESSFAAYFILRGELKLLKISCTAMNPSGEHSIPNFVKGNWVGENALVSSILKCSATFITMGISSFMVVRGDLFQGLISRFGLMEQFQQFCSEHLWRGMCGRCGQLGTHFSDVCHTRSKLLRKGNRSNSFNLVGKMNSTASSGSKEKLSQIMMPNLFQPYGSNASAPAYGSERSGLERAVQAGSDLKEYLKEKDVNELLQILLSMEIFSLDDLESADRGAIKQQVVAAFGALDGPPAAANGTEGAESLNTEDALITLLDEALSDESIDEFRARRAYRVHQALFTAVSRLQHLCFLSHYKIEAGTEAALMRSELEVAMSEDDGLGPLFDEPVFLDSENLFNLEDLQRRVRNTHNLVLLLTKGVLSRPWVLIEILTARREGVRILLVNVSKPGESVFVFPDDAFFNSIRDGTYLDEEARELLQGQGYALAEVEETLRSVFQQIAVPYSPHKATNIRKAEIATLLKQCRLKESQDAAHQVPSSPRLPRAETASTFSCAPVGSDGAASVGGVNSKGKGKMHRSSVDSTINSKLRRISVHSFINQ